MLALISQPWARQGWQLNGIVEFDYEMQSAFFGQSNERDALLTKNVTQQYGQHIVYSSVQSVTCHTVSEMTCLHGLHTQYVEVFVTATLIQIPLWAEWIFFPPKCYKIPFRRRGYYFAGVWWKPCENSFRTSNHKKSHPDFDDNTFVTLCTCTRAAERSVD